MAQTARQKWYFCHKQTYEKPEPIEHCVLENKTIQITIASRTYRVQSCGEHRKKKKKTFLKRKWRVSYVRSVCLRLSVGVCV